MTRADLPGLYRKAYMDTLPAQPEQGTTAMATFVSYVFDCIALVLILVRYGHDPLATAGSVTATAAFLAYLGWAPHGIRFGNFVNLVISLISQLSPAYLAWRLLIWPKMLPPPPPYNGEDIDCMRAILNQAVMAVEAAHATAIGLLSAACLDRQREALGSAAERTLPDFLPALNVALARFSEAHELCESLLSDAHLRAAETADIISRPGYIRLDETVADSLTEIEDIKSQITAIPRKPA